MRRRGRVRGGVLGEEKLGWWGGWGERVVRYKMGSGGLGDTMSLKKDGW